MPGPYLSRLANLFLTPEHNTSLKSPIRTLRSSGLLFAPTLLHANVTLLLLAPSLQKTLLHFATIATDVTYDETVTNDIITSVSSKIHSQAQQHLPSCKVFEYEVFKSLSTISKTSPGPDDTPYWLFKHFAVELTPVITHILNLTLALGKPPTLWKRAVITPVPKVPHPKELSDFRPISVTPLLSRITERILYISSYYQNLPTNSLVDQFAYRPTCSTTSCLVALEHLVAKYLETVS